MCFVAGCLLVGVIMGIVTEQCVLLLHGKALSSAAGALTGLEFDKASCAPYVGACVSLQAWFTC